MKYSPCPVALCSGLYAHQSVGIKQNPGQVRVFLFVCLFVCLFTSRVVELYLFCFCFLGLHPWPMELPRLGVESELQLQDYTTATTMRNLSHVFDLHPSSQQCGILNPLSEARDRTCILMDTNRIHFCCTTTGTPLLITFNWAWIILSCGSIDDSLVCYL